MRERRLAFNVWCSPFGVQRLAFGVWRRSQDIGKRYYLSRLDFRRAQSGTR
jgi:hypothetical protein